MYYVGMLWRKYLGIALLGKKFHGIKHGIDILNTQVTTRAFLSSVLFAACTGVGDDVAVGALVLLQGEARQVEAGHDLHRVHVLPLVHQVVSRPPV